MISITTVIAIIAIHFFADFVCQTDQMAVNKSKSNYWLRYHVLVYSIVTFIAWHFCFLQPSDRYHIKDYLALFGFIYYMHLATDYVTSRISGHYFGKGDKHNGFVVIGFDQVLHYIQLLTAYWLFIH